VGTGRRRKGGRRERERKEDSPNTLDISLLDLHIDVDGPKVESLRVAIDDSLEDGLASLGVSVLELELSELGDGFDV